MVDYSGLPQSENSITSQFNQFFYDAYRTWGLYYAAAYRDLRAYAGDNWTNLEKTKLERQNRMILELNKIRRVVNLYSGYERENRTATVCAPVEGSDVKTADQFSDILYYVYEKANADYIISEAFEHSLKTGLAIIGLYMDYSRDKVNGDIKMYWKPFNALMLDPYFTKRDLSDCDQASTRDLLSKEQIKSLLPWIEPSVIDNLPTGIRDNKYQYLGIYRQYNSTYIAKNLCTYDQYWKRINKVQKYLVDMETGVTEEFNGDGEEEAILKNQLREDAARRAEMGLSPRLELITSHKRSVELNIIVSGQLLYSGPDPTGLDDYPFVPVLLYHEPLIDTFELKIQGIVRSVRDAQRQYNRRHSQIIDLMESIINTGYITKNGAVLDPNMLMQAGQGKQIVVNEGYDVNADIREISPPNIPPGYLQYQDIIDKNIMEIPGASDELLGLSSVGDSQVSGKLAEVRASNGLKGNRGIFDNLEQSKKYLGLLVIEAIQKNYSPGKVARIIGEEPTEQFFSGQFEEYDCAIKQAVKTSTQREAYYYQLLQLVALGAPIPWADIMEVAPLQGSTKLHEVMRQQAEQAQQAAQAEQEAMQMQKMLDMAAVNQSTALAEERRARVLADIGLAKERESEVTQNHAKAFLDNAKTIAQIQDIPQKRMVEVLKLASQIKAQEKQEAEAELQKDMKRAEALKQ
jgi:hypothetical protein